jgi:hypothetical protein
MPAESILFPCRRMNRIQFKPGEHSYRTAVARFSRGNKKFILHNRRVVTKGGSDDALTVETEYNI